MWSRWLMPRFSIRTLLLMVAAIAVGLWSYLYLPDILHNRQDRLSRAAIDPYELSVAGDGDPAKAPPELVAILGDSRLKHWAGVGDVAFVDKTTLFSRGRDEMARFWDTTNGRQIRVMPAKVCAIGGDSAKLFLVSPSKADVIEVWDTVKWKRDAMLDLKQGRPCLGLMASGDGSRFGAVFGDNAQELEVHVWNVDPPALVGTFTKVKPNRRSGQLDQAGRRIALYDGELARIWEVDTGRELGKAGPFRIETSKAELDHCLFLPTAPNEVITSDSSGQIVIWNYATGQEVSRLNKTPGTTSVLTVEPRNPTLFVGEGSNVYEYVCWGQEWRLWEEVTPDAAHGVGDVAYRNGTLAFACSDHAVVLKPGILASNSWPDVTHLAFDPVGRFVATASRSGEISIWQMKTWRHIRSWPANRERLSQLVFTPDGLSLVSLGNDEAVVWDHVAGAERVRISTGGNHPRQCAISPDGQFLASTFMRTGPSPQVIQLWKTADGTIHKTIAHPTARRRGQLAFVDSNTLVMGGGKGMTVWDLANSKLIADLGSRTIHDVPLAVHPDGKRVIMQPWYSTIEVWDIQAQKMLLGTNPHGGQSLAASIAIHPEGRLASSVADNGIACLWEINTGAIVKSWQLGPPKGCILQVAFSPDGRYLATVNGNGTAYILRLDGIVGTNK